MSECELLNTCGFFKKHMNSHEAACKGLITQYCRGHKQEDCKRKEYRKQNGKPPEDSMLPNGSMLRTV